MAEPTDTPFTVSPTGTPILPQNAVRIGAILVGIAGVLAANTQPSLLHTILATIAWIGGALGVVSQGVRK
jgi:hypothetical protein